PQLENEYNDQTGNANLLSLTSPGIGSMQGTVAGAQPAGDGGDYYSLSTLNTGNSISASLSVPSFGTLATSDVVLSIEEQGTGTVASSTSGTLNYQATSDGVYFIRVQASANQDLRAQYLLHASFTDAVPPAITGTSLPSEGGTTTG